MTADEPRVPLALDERVLDRHYLRDPRTGDRVADEDLAALGSAVGVARESANQIAALAVALRADGTRTKEAAALELRKGALKAAERGARALDAALERANATIARLETETAGPPAPPAGSYALLQEGEIRAALRAMDPKERDAVIATAFKDGDDSVIGAALRGHPMLSGLHPAKLATLRHRWRRERHPAEYDRIVRLRAAVESASDGGQSLVRFTEKASANPAIRAAEQSARAMEKALADINGGEDRHL